jgi:hypothetical protein
MIPAKRYFNTSGPNIWATHYTLDRATVVQKGIRLVHQMRYFTIWAPRQTGKSTYFKLLAEALSAQGYLPCWVNFENYATSSLGSFLNKFSFAIQEYWGIDVIGLELSDVFNTIERLKDKKLVLIIDEVEGINPEYFGAFLHGIRNLYHSREDHALKSVIFVGISNITGVAQDNASPFNISDSLNLNYFTKAEVAELLEQHESETGQLFEPLVKEKIYTLTAGQPGLVNGIANKLVENNPDKPMIDYLDFLTVENWYLYKAIDKNISNIINKAKVHQKFLEELLFLERKVQFDIDQEKIRFFYVNGLIKDDENGDVVFWVPLYKKRLLKYFYPIKNGESQAIHADLWAEKYLTANNELDMEKVIRGYQTYAKRRGFRYFIEYDEHEKPKGLREAALIYSFETYIQSILEAFRGKSYIEPHVGLGRSDLVINIANKEWVVESKIFYNGVQFAEGKNQLAYYTNRLGLAQSIYLVFVNKEVKNPYIVESEEIIEGVKVATYLVRYDTETDFTDPDKIKKKRKKKSD